MKNDYSDKAAFIKAIREEEPAVFDYLRKQYYGVIRALVCDNNGDEDDAEDIYIEGIAGLVVILKRPGAKLKSEAISLLYKICYKRWMKVLRKRKAERLYKKSINGPEIVEDSAEQIMKNIQSNIFYQSFEKLKEECRTIFKHLFTKKKIKDIAEIMGVTLSSAYKKKERCYISLLEIVRNHPDYGEAVNKGDSTGY